MIEYLWKLTRFPPVDLVAQTLLAHDSLNASAVEIFGAYDEFLGLLSDSEARSRLEKLAYEDAATDETYERVRSLGHQFQRGLTTLFFEDITTRIPELTKIFGVF
jgi:hypothetical protein